MRQMRADWGQQNVCRKNVYLQVRVCVWSVWLQCVCSQCVCVFTWCMCFCRTRVYFQCVCVFLTRVSSQLVCVCLLQETGNTQPVSYKHPSKDRPSGYKGTEDSLLPWSLQFTVHDEHWLTSASHEGMNRSGEQRHCKLFCCVCFQIHSLGVTLVSSASAS